VITYRLLALKEGADRGGTQLHVTSSRVWLIDGRHTGWAS